MSESYRADVRRVEKPWGHELVFAATERYAGKILAVRAGEELSLQYHRAKDETLYLHEGTAEVQVGERREELDWEPCEPGTALRIRPGVLHRIRARSDCVFLESSTAELDDVVRLEDRYGRQGPDAGRTSPG